MRIFFAQHLGLALLQAHRTVAMGAGQLHRGQQFGMPLKKIWRVGQVAGDVVFRNGRHTESTHKVSGRVISPWKTVVAGPVMRTGVPRPSHSIVN